MKKNMQEIAVYILLLVLVSTGFWLYRNHGQDVLSYSVDLLGKTLVSMARDEDERQKIEQLYARFTQDINDNKIQPERIEKVAASILNLSHNNAKLSQEQADLILNEESILKTTLAEDHSTFKENEHRFKDNEHSLQAELEKMEVDFTMRLSRFDEPEAPSSERDITGQMAESDRRSFSSKMDSLAVRLKSVLDFNQKLKSASAASERAKVAAGKSIYYNSAGLNIIIDPVALRELLATTSSRVSAHIADLERQKIVRWKPDLLSSLKARKRRLRSELSYLKEMKRQDRNHQKHYNEYLDEMEKLKQIETLGLFGTDSLQTALKE